MEKQRPQMSKFLRTFLWVLLDVVLINLAMILAQVLRYSPGNLNRYYYIYFRLIPALTVINIAVYALFGIYRIMWQYASAEDLLRIAAATLAGAAATLVFSLVADTFAKENMYRLPSLWSKMLQSGYFLYFLSKCILLLSLSVFIKGSHYPKIIFDWTSW